MQFALEMSTNDRAFDIENQALYTISIPYLFAIISTYFREYLYLKYLSYFNTILLNILNIKYLKCLIFANCPQEHIGRKCGVWDRVQVFIVAAEFWVNLSLIRRLKGQIPEIKQTLEILKYMQKKKVSVFLFVNMSEPGYFRRGASSLTVCHWCQPSRAHVLTFRDKRGFVVPPTPANQV